MSIILKGIDLPKKGERYHIFIENGRIRCDKWTNTNRSYLDERYEGEIEIQAIQIPKRHGDIKDVDKLRKGFSRTESGYCGYWEFCDKPEDMQFLIDDEPTILDEEGK